MDGRYLGRNNDDWGLSVFVCTARACDECGYWQVQDKISENQKRFMLMEQLKQIKKELGLEKDDKEELLSKFRKRLVDKTVPEDVQAA